MLIDILNHGLRVEEIPVLMTHRETKRDLKVLFIEEKN